MGPAENNNLYKLTTPAPADYQRILDNLIRVESTFKFLHECNQSHRLEYAVCMRILNQALPEDEVLKYITKLTSLREEHKEAAITAGECSEAGWENHFLSAKYSETRLTHMCKFIQDMIGVQRLSVARKEMSLGTKEGT